MNRRTTVFRMAIVLAHAFGLTLSPQVSGKATAASPEVVRVSPEETDELLPNPGIGWETFHTTRDKDRNLPGWIPSTVHYARWGWGTLEPRPGQIDYDFLDKTLERRGRPASAWRSGQCAARQRPADHIIRIGSKMWAAGYSRSITKIKRAWLSLTLMIRMY